MQPADSGRAAWCGALAGGLKGLFLGLLPAVWALTPFGAEQPEIRQAALAAPLVSFTLGLLLGLVQAKRNKE